ncbi:hypothetical protein [Pseudonocardia hydrocarbonoxydans]|uniref:Uncharacterized protein n=1 Tax=Pseudonocardia hydrocarbonoxydans TaxID=76726 RepID=A0A4Y3WXN5_9PSEU|nr:hypothetical protein PHY01_44890 [Pseudonocardia hydrocarbonoxydans]
MADDGVGPRLARIVAYSTIAALVVALLAFANDVRGGSSPGSPPTYATPPASIPSAEANATTAATDPPPETSEAPRFLELQVETSEGFARNEIQNDVFETTIVSSGTPKAGLRIRITGLTTDGPRPCTVSYRIVSVATGEIAPEGAGTTGCNAKVLLYLPVGDYRVVADARMDDTNEQAQSDSHTFQVVRGPGA